MLRPVKSYNTLLMRDFVRAKQLASAELALIRSRMPAGSEADTKERLSALVTEINRLSNGIDAIERLRRI